MKHYIASFDPTDRNGRFFRKLSLSKSGVIKATHQVIGKHKLAGIGKTIAQTLGLEDWQKYTGHCWRRTGATLMANAGLSLAQIRSATGQLFLILLFEFIFQCSM